MKFILAAKCTCCERFTMTSAEAESLPPGSSDAWHVDGSYETERAALEAIGLPESFVVRSVCNCGALVVLTNYPVGEVRCEHCL